MTRIPILMMKNKKIKMLLLRKKKNKNTNKKLKNSCKWKKIQKRDIIWMIKSVRKKSKKNQLKMEFMIQKSILIKIKEKKLMHNQQVFFISYTFYNKI